MEAHSVSERRACRVVGQPRSVQREEVKVDEQQQRLVADMRRHSAAQPRYGYRRVHALLAAQGWRVNHKHVHRLWREEGLWVPRRKRKKTRLGCSENGILRMQVMEPNHVWTYDFVMDRTYDGRRLKLLTVADEFTRESLAIHVARKIDSRGVIEVLAAIAAKRGMPKYIRSDNGPEFIAGAVQAWLKERGGATLYIAPGNPWENAYIESFNGKLRDEMLASEEFSTVTEAQYLATRWRTEYNERRPHSSLGYRTPAAFAAVHGMMKDAKPKTTQVGRGDEGPLSSPEPTPLPSVCRGTKADKQDDDTAAEAAVKVDTMVMLS